MDKKYGLKFDSFDPNHFFLGGGFLGTTEINPSGDWSNFAPVMEYQAKNGIDTQACTRFGTCNALEILFSFVLHEDKNFSDRFLSIVAGASRTGDSPQTVAETVRKIGCIDESDLPFSDDIDTLDKYYSPNPMNEYLLNKGKTFNGQYEIRHEWVYPIGQVSNLDEQTKLIQQALKRSPVGVSVSAWSEDGKGGYDQQWGENHWCVILKGDDPDYWEIYDSYDNFIKKYSKKAKITMAKIYTVRKLTVEDKLTVFNKFWNWVMSVLSKEVTETTVNVVEPIVKKSDLTIGVFCLAIQEFEGWVKPGEKGRDGKVYQTGSRSFRNSNPGNLKYINNMYLAIGQDSGGFARFGTYKDGFMALSNKIKKACNGESTVYSPDDTILSFFQKYAPTSDGNYPHVYAKYVADKLKVDTDFQIKNLV